jgi:O-antigen/teichoic acid export membrane protein
MYAVVYATLQLGTVVGAFALGLVAVREVRRRGWAARPATVAVAKATIAIAMVVGLGSIFALRSIYPELHAPLLSVALLLAVVAAASLQNSRVMTTGLLSSQGSAVSLVAERLLVLGFVVLSVAVARTVPAAITGVAVGIVLTAVGLLLWLLRGTNAAPTVAAQPVRLRPALHGAARVVSGNLVQFVTYRLDIFLLAALAGSEATGVYAVSVGLASVLWFLPDALGQATYGQTCTDISHGHSPMSALRASRHALAATVGLSILTAAVSPFAIPAVFGEEYSSSVPLLLALLPGICLFSLPKVLGGVLVAAGREWAASGSYALAAVITLAGDLLLIPRHGAMGAAIASSIAYASAAGLICWQVARFLKSQQGTALRASTPAS